jgi:hypothetical protein
MVFSLWSYYSSIQINRFKKILRKEIVFSRKSYSFSLDFFLIDVRWLVEVASILEYL